MACTAGRLTTNDSAVLCALFDPESSLSNAIEIDLSLPATIEAQKSSLLQQEECDALRPLNQREPSRPEILHTIERLDRIIHSNPEYASALSNRAQARRLLFKEGDLAKFPEDFRSMIDDLTKAISLATPSVSTARISSKDARTLAAAHTHRGYLLLFAGKSKENMHMLDKTESLRHLQKEELEEMASRDFSLGGRYGNDTARQAAVKTNPYAKLCGSIVKEALQKEIEDIYRIPQHV